MSSAEDEEEQSESGAEIAEDAAFKDRRSDVKADIFKCHEINDIGTGASDGYRYYLSRYCDVQCNSPDPTWHYMIPSTNTLAHRIIYYFMMDGAIPPLPKEVSREQYKDYLDLTNLTVRIDKDNLFLANDVLHKSLDVDEAQVILSLSEDALLRYIYLAEQSALAREQSQDPFPEANFTSLLWVSDADWSDPIKGYGPVDTTKRYYCTRSDSGGKEVIIRLAELEWTYFKYKGVVFRSTYSSEGKFVGVEVYAPVQDGTVPVIYNPPLKTFLSTMHPVIITAVFVYAFTRRLLKYPNQRWGSGKDRIFRRYHLSQYLLRLVTSDYPSQFRVLDFGRPSEMPFPSPKDDAPLAPDNWNYIRRPVYSRPHPAWSAAVFLNSPLVDVMMTGNLDETFPPSPITPLYNGRTSDMIEIGKAIFESMRRLALQYADVAERYRRGLGVSVNETKCWLLTTPELAALDDRLETLGMKFEAVKSIMVYNMGEHEEDIRVMTEAIYEIDPGERRGPHELKEVFYGK